jgi:hypothetical protein
MPALTKAAENVARIEKALAEAEIRLEALEGDRGKVGLAADAEAVDGYHIELFKAASAVKTFQAALDAAKAAEAEAADKEKKRLLEARHHAVLAETTATYTAERPNALRAMEDLIAALGAIGSAAATAGGWNMQAEHAGRDDLVIKTVTVPRLTAAATAPRPPALARDLNETHEAFTQRQEANDTKWAAEMAHAQRPREPLESEEDFAKRQAEAVRKVKRTKNEANSSYGQRVAEAKARIVRRGETDDEYAIRKAAAKFGIWRGEDEREEAWRLRAANVQARAQRRDEIDDPLKLAGEKAIALIQEHALGMSAYELKRRYPYPVSSRTLMAGGGNFMVQAGRTAKITPVRR